MANREEVSKQVQSAISPLTKTLQELKNTQIEHKVYHESHATLLKAIREQVTETNGRVKKLELWRMFIVGGLSVLSLIVIPLLFLFIEKVL